MAERYRYSWKTHLRAMERHLPYVITNHLTQVNTPHLNTHQISQYSTYLPQKNEKLSWPWCRLYTVMAVYLFTDSHKYFLTKKQIAMQTGAKPMPSWLQVQCPNRYSTMATIITQSQQEYWHYKAVLLTRTWPSRPRPRTWPSRPRPRTWPSRPRPRT